MSVDKEFERWCDENEEFISERTVDWMFEEGYTGDDPENHNRYWDYWNDIASEMYYEL